MNAGLRDTSARTADPFGNGASASHSPVPRIHPRPAAFSTDDPAASWRVQQETIIHIAQGATVAVVDGQKLSLFRNTGSDAHPKLSALPDEGVNTANKSGGSGHASSSANPDEATQNEDGFAAGVAELLNRQAIAGTITALLIIAAPKTLGELRKHYHSKTKEALVGEISKDLTGQKSADIENAIAAA